jgi:hypothetical protein
MKYTYRLTSDSDGITASCVEMSALATGTTSAEAVAALRDAICERLTHVEAVAPPEPGPAPSIELVPAREPGHDPQDPSDPRAPRDAQDRRDPQGPGDSPAAEHTGTVRSD